MKLIKISEKKIASNNIAREKLPFPVVYYPAFYGTFFCFSEKRHSEKYFCNCSEAALENYIDIRTSEPIIKSADPTREYILDSFDFPKIIVIALMDLGCNSKEEILSRIKFEKNLCHVCNKVVPKLRYCHRQYGSDFKQAFGWYINKQAFSYGITRDYKVTGSCCPSELLSIIESAPKFMEPTHRFSNRKEEMKYHKESTKKRRRILNYIENQVRVELNYSKVGEAWKQETELANIVKCLYPGYEVITHFRGSFLEGLELDIYIPQINLAIEYQGLQHYNPIDHWGGEEALLKTIERDIRKKELCENNEIKLIYFKYDEEINIDNIRIKISKYCDSHGDSIES